MKRTLIIGVLGFLFWPVWLTPQLRLWIHEAQAQMPSWIYQDAQSVISAPGFISLMSMMLLGILIVIIKYRIAN